MMPGWMPFLAFPWELSLRRWRCPSASHHPVPLISQSGLSLPPHTPFLSLGRLCQRSPWTLCFTALRQVRRAGGGEAATQVEVGPCWASAECDITEFPSPTMRMRTRGGGGGGWDGSVSTS